VDELCLGICLLFERFNAELKVDVKGGIANGYGDGGCEFDLHASELVILYVNAILFLLHIAEK
jgi:hypothetical protein